MPLLPVRIADIRSMNYQYLFGKSVIQARASATRKRKVFLIGAYPSALHIRWSHPELARPIAAVAVDNEPEPFWTGIDEIQRIESWKTSVQWRTQWGIVQPCGSLNGSSGVWVRGRVLCPLRLQRNETWLTDCLDFYCESVGAQRRTQSHEVQSILTEFSIPAPLLHSHPEEDKVVSIARDQNHLARIRHELLVSQPDLIITLGNAALRVIREVLGPSGSLLPEKLSSSPDLYGRSILASLNGHGKFNVLPLAHPAAPDAYQKVHDRWIESKLD